MFQRYNGNTNALIADLFSVAADFLETAANNARSRFVDGDPLVFSDRTAASGGFFSIFGASASEQPYTAEEILLATASAFDSNRIVLALGESHASAFKDWDIEANEEADNHRALLFTHDYKNPVSLDSDIVIAIGCNLNVTSIKAKVLIAINSNLEADTITADKHALIMADRVTAGTISVANGFIAVNDMEYRKCNAVNMRFATPGDVYLDGRLAMVGVYDVKSVNAAIKHLAKTIVEFMKENSNGEEETPIVILNELTGQYGFANPTPANPKNYTKPEILAETKPMRDFYLEIREQLNAAIANPTALKDIIATVAEDKREFFMSLFHEIVGVDGKKIMSANSKWLGTPVASAFSKTLKETAAPTTENIKNVVSDVWEPATDTMAIAALDEREWALVGERTNKELETFLMKYTHIGLIGKTKKEMVAQLKVFSGMDPVIADRIREFLIAKPEQPASAEPIAEVETEVASTETASTECAATEPEEHNK